MKLLLATLLLASSNAFAQSVSCQPHGKSEISKIEITKPEYSFNVPWYVAKVTNNYRQVKIFTVTPTSRKDRLLFSGKSKSEFSLDFGTFKGPGTYHTVQATLNEGSALELKSQIMCTVGEDVPFTNLCENDPQNVLFQAALNRNLDEVESAVACEVDADAKNKNGCSPLMLVADPMCGVRNNAGIKYASMTSAFPLVDFLTNNGATLEHADPATGERALHKFAKAGDFDTVDLLLNLEADVNAQDNAGHTPLMRAVENNDRYLVLRILEADPDLDIKNKKGLTALGIAKDRKFKKLEAYLEKPALTIEVQGNDDGTCSVADIKIPVGKVTRFVLKATEKKMFLLEAPEIGLSAMAHEGQEAAQNIIPARKGEVTYSCGIHGGATQTTGKIIIE